MLQTGTTLSDDHLNLAGGSVRLRTQELEAWIETLPLADVGETYQRVEYQIHIITAHRLLEPSGPGIHARVIWELPAGRRSLASIPHDDGCGVKFPGLLDEEAEV